MSRRPPRAHRDRPQQTDANRKCVPKVFPWRAQRLAKTGPELGTHHPASVPPNRFLEWTVADGWAPLCDLLALPVPNEPFPWTNTTDEFRAHNGLDSR
jgi:hypothetical protein